VLAFDSRERQPFTELSQNHTFLASLAAYGALMAKLLSDQGARDWIRRKTVR